jgi:hypothetical protein
VLVTLLVQSSSATTMTTIGLVSAGLLSFPQGVGLVFGANIGTTAAAPGDATPATTIERLAHCASELASLGARHRRATLESAGSGKLAASDAIANVDAVRLLGRRAHHAWRAAAYLAGAVA